MTKKGKRNMMKNDYVLKILKTYPLNRISCDDNKLTHHHYSAKYFSSSLKEDYMSVTKLFKDISRKQERKKYMNVRVGGIGPVAQFG